MSVQQRRVMFAGGSSTGSPQSSGSSSATPVASPPSVHRSGSILGKSAQTQGLAMSPPSAASSSASASRYSTMPAAALSKGAIPHSNAPDNKPDAARVYAGMNAGAGREQARATWWKAIAAAAPPSASASSSASSSPPSDSFLSELALELDVGHFERFVPQLSARDFEAVARMLREEAGAQGREAPGPGHAHLAARILLACEREEKQARAIFNRVAEKMRTYEADAPAWSLLRNDVLRLTELLLANPLTAHLCHHFNELGFDLVDLSDVAVTWVSGLFCPAAFPTEFCLRCVDLLLLPSGAPEQLVGVLYGTLHVLQMKLLECTSAEALFTALSDLPAALTRAQIGEVFTQAYWLHERCAAKNDLDWVTLVNHVQGPIRFQSVEMIKAMSGGGTGATNAAAAPSTSSTAASLLASHTPLSSTPSRPPGSSGHGHSSSMTFNLSDYSPDSRATTAAASASGTPAGAEAATVAAGKDAQRGSVVAPAGNAGAVTAADHTLMADLAAATSSGSKTPAQLQALLERALRELKAHQQQQQGSGQNRASIVSGSAAAPASGSTGAASSASSYASTSVTSSDVSAGIRSLHSSLYQIAPLEVHPLDRSSGGPGVRKVVPPSGLIKYSELLDYQLYPCVLMQGYLMKSRAPSKLFKRKGSSGFFGNLHRRYFVQQGSFLTYFKTHDQTKPSRDESLDLRTCVATKIKNHEYGPFAFKIESKEKGAVVYLLFASNETVRDVWLECLAQATQVPALGV